MIEEGWLRVEMESEERILQLLICTILVAIRLDTPNCKPIPDYYASLP